jgi:hypothetical protein
MVLHALRDGVDSAHMHAHTFTFSLHVQIFALWSCGHASLVPPCELASTGDRQVQCASLLTVFSDLCEEEHAWPGGFIHAHACMALCWPGA